MALEEHKSKARYGRSKLRFNLRSHGDIPTLSIHQRLREKKQADGKNELLMMTLDFRLDAIVAEFIIELNALTKAGGDISAIYTLTDYQQAAIEHAHKNANREIKCIGIVDMSGIEILNDLQSRAKKLLEDHPRLICLQCAHKR